MEDGGTLYLLRRRDEYGRSNYVATMRDDLEAIRIMCQFLAQKSPDFDYSVVTLDGTTVYPDR